MRTGIGRRPARITASADWQEFLKHPPDTALQQVGLVDPSFSSTSIAMRELTGIAILRIHSLQPFSVLRDGMAACDIPLPADVNRSEGQDPTALCLAPREWLLFSEYLGYRRLAEQVRAVSEMPRTTALDFSDGLAVFRLSGRAAPWLLSKWSGLDFHGRPPAAAYCARTRMQQVAVTLHYHQPGGFATESVFDLMVDRSLATYLWQLFLASVAHAEELERQFGNNR